MKKWTFSLILLFLPLAANADAVEIDGIYYNLFSKAKQAEVTSNPNKYIGNITIPDIVTYESVEYNVTSIGDYAFKDCEGLFSVSIPNNVTTIGNWAFGNCSQTSVTIGNNVTSIGDAAFYGCSGLTFVTIPNSVTTIGTNAFCDCKGLTSMNIPNSVTIIRNNAFLGCTNLTSVTIGCGLNYLSAGIFQGCTSLTSVTIPNSVEEISSSAFRDCTSLTSVTIPNGVNTISAGAFSNCTGLTSIVIGSGVYDIGNSAFGNCANLTDVYCLRKNAVFVNTEAFTYTEYATLHVPEGSVGSYQGKEPWSKFNRIIDYDEVSVSSSKIRTYSSAFDLDLTNVTGLSAYVISDFDASEGILTITPVTSVKAGEGLLLKGDAGDYELPYTTTDATYTNYLVGVPTTTSISPSDGDYTNFVLANGTHGVNFYALSKTGNISAGKAYLKLPTADINKSNLSRGFVIDDNGTTSISTPIRNEYDDMLYDLQGRRVNKPSKGLYIMNGKKVIIK